MNEPIADAARSILDGHLWLSRRLANRGQYPAIDPLESVSRVMTDVVSDAHRKAAQEARGLLAIYQEHEDLINLGAYVKGANPRLDRAVALIESFRAYLKQDMRERSTLAEAVRSRTFERAGEPAPRQTSVKASISRWRLPTLRAAGARRPGAPRRGPWAPGPQILELASLTGSVAPRRTADPPRQGSVPRLSHGPAGWVRSWCAGSRLWRVLENPPEAEAAALPCWRPSRHEKVWTACASAAGSLASRRPRGADRLGRRAFPVFRREGHEEGLARACLWGPSWPWP